MIELVQIVYKIIYNRKINFILRNINKFLKPVLPDKIKIPPSGVIKIRNSSGNILKIKTNQTNYLTYLIFWEGGYKRFEYTDIFIRLIRKVRTFYDIGANIGYYSLLAAMENKEANIVGFEPASGPLFYFKENVRINSFKNIEVESVALSHKDGEIDFYEIKNRKYRYLEHNLGGESNTGSKTTGRNFVLTKVKTTKLDNYVKIRNDKSIDLIKMDTEGTENLILENSDYVLREMRPIIICETIFNTIEPELDRIMSSYGYEFYNHTAAGLQKQKTIIRKEDNGVSNCFFVHPSKYYLIEEFVAE
ncbi:MAG TPA: FkbM family methyltransferase [Bacteroidales bacterium]|nr:FkbM family methyltransferase [Bacteroidales bacterium]